MNQQKLIKLPDPKYKGEISVEEALINRRSIRVYKSKLLQFKEISQLLFAAQGITNKEGLRTTPSAGALYPIDIYFLVGWVENLSAGIYKYHQKKHEVEKIISGDLREKLSRVALDQDCVREGAVVFVITAQYLKTTQKYGDRGIKYVQFEAGSVAENIFLQATTLKLGTVIIGAFYDEEVKEVMNLSDYEYPLLIMPVGRIG